MIFAFESSFYSVILL